MTLVLTNDPTPQAQLDFLQSVQRLLNEGTFTATYKFALLLALADLCVEQGTDIGGTLQLDTSQVAEKFIQYYWPHTRPYMRPLSPAASVGRGLILRQNAGAPAVVLTTLKALVDQGWSFADIRRSDKHWPKVVGKVRRVVTEMTLWKLQVIGQAPVEFLYRHNGTGEAIELQPGVMYCLRRFHGLVTDLARGAWVRYIRRHNQDVLGSPTDLDEFLFGSERASLARYVPILREVQKARCFYCGHEVRGGDEQSHVDHFIPWSRYPVDLGHNFVYTHSRCNLAKADHLAAAEHLAHWSEHNQLHGAVLAQRFADAKIIHSFHVSPQITQWAYQQAVAAGALTWSRGTQLTILGPEWIKSIGE